MCDDSIGCTFDKCVVQHADFRSKTILNENEQSELEQSLEVFLKKLPIESIASTVATESGTEKSEIIQMIETFANESRVTLALIINQLHLQNRILEVGAGLCLLSLFLRESGFQVSALEPALGGFGLFEQLKKEILNHYSQIELGVIDKPAQDLKPQSDGTFDLIFSNNVIEHIPDWQDALTAMTTVLSEKGVMIHACPNYTIPYEPHYGIPVFRRFPEISRKLFLSSESNSEIWESLNFITCKEIMSYCSNRGLSFCFRKELLYNAIKRIHNDELFRERHPGLVSKSASFIMMSGLGSIIRKLPPSLSTPLIVEIRHNGRGN